VGSVPEPPGSLESRIARHAIINSQGKTWPLIAEKGGLHTHRRFPVTDLEAGITAGFVNFNQSLPDVHIFKIRNGKIELIQAVFGGRTRDTIWPDEKK
jgi:hypothetical protein